MSTRNGHHRTAKPATRKPAKRLKVAREASNQTDIVSAIQELTTILLRREDMWAYGAVGTTQHFQRHGKNYPFFDSEATLANLRAQSRILCGTGTYGKGLLEGLASYVLGDGLTYTIRARQNVNADQVAGAVRSAQAVVDNYLKSNQWLGGEQPGLEHEFFIRSRRDGEAILCHFPQDDGTTQSRFVEPDMMRQPPGSTMDEWSFGVRNPVNPVDTSRALGYWFCWDFMPESGEEYEPDYVTHFRCNVDRNVKRGMPDFVFEVLDGLNAAGKLRDAIGETAAEQASIASVMQYENASGDQVESLISTDADYQVTDAITGLLENIKRFKKGTNLHVPKGQEYIEGPSAANATSHLAVLDMLLKSASRPWNAPDWLASGDASSGSYATSLTEESPFIKRVKREQRPYCEALKTAVWFALRHWCETRGLRADGRSMAWEEVKSLVELDVTAPSPQVRNKIEEAQRDQVYVGIGAKSVQIVAEEQGYDWERVQRDRDAFKADNPDMAGNPLTLDAGPSAPPSLPRTAGGMEDSDEMNALAVRELIDMNRKLSGLTESSVVTAPQPPPQFTVQLHSGIVEEALQRLKPPDVVNNITVTPAEVTSPAVVNNITVAQAELVEAIRSGQRMPEGFLDTLREAIEADKERPINLTIAKGAVQNTNNVAVPPAEVTVNMERKPSRVKIEADSQGNITGAKIEPE